MSTAVARGFGWIAIVRLGLVQAAIGAIVMLATSLLNRVMVVEYALAAAIPAGLVAWHYAVQLARRADDCMLVDSVEEDRSLTRRAHPSRRSQ